MRPPSIFPSVCTPTFGKGQGLHVQPVYLLKRKELDMLGILYYTIITTEHLRLHSGRPSFALRWLSPIGACGGRYHSQLKKGSWITVPAFVRAAQDIYAIMPIDIAPYLHHLDRMDLNAAQKAELIHNVSDIMKSFVDQAFGIDPVQQALAARAKDDSGRAAKRIQSKGPMLNSQFEPAAEDGADRKS